MNNTSKIVVVATVLAAGFTATADPAMPAVGSERNYTGMVVSVDPQDHRINVRSWPLSHKEFNLGDNCAYVLVGVSNGTATDLRPGQRITVRYQDAHGVLIADRVEQRPMESEGMVAAIDPSKHTLILHRRGLDESMSIADACTIMLRNNTPGVLADIRPGDHVTVIYERPNDLRTARQISQTSREFTGKLTAIDLDQKVMKARDTFETMKFTVADNCAIVINGQPDGKLAQLKPDERLVFDYDTINGVNVVNRIAPARLEEPRNNMSSATPHNLSYPAGY